MLKYVFNATYIIKVGKKYLLITLIRSLIKTGHQLLLLRLNEKRYIWINSNKKYRTYLSPPPPFLVGTEYKLNKHLETFATNRGNPPNWWAIDISKFFHGRSLLWKQELFLCILEDHI